jgi:uncharacterized DUF497 family protein
VIFEWDDAKSLRNLLERGFGFDHAVAIFVGPTLEARSIISARLASKKERRLWQSFVERWSKSSE